jgi:bifunctional enzyme CysN/CysC
VPVQYVNRPNLDFRGFSGTVASGIVRPGDEVAAAQSGQKSRVRSIVTYEGEVAEAFPPMAVTLTLEDEIDVSRGDALVHPGNLPRVDRSFDAMVVWMAEEPLTPGKGYLFKQTTNLVSGQVNAIRYRVDVNTMHREPAATLAMNEVARCRVLVNRRIAFDPYKRNRATGAFIVIDRLTNRTVGAGMILDRTEDPEAAGARGEGVTEALSILVTGLEGGDRVVDLSMRPTGDAGGAAPAVPALTLDVAATSDEEVARRIVKWLREQATAGSRRGEDGADRGPTGSDQ